MICGVEATRDGVRGVASCGAAGASGGMLGTGVGAAGRLTCPCAVPSSCRWWMTRAVNAPSMATALATMISRYLFDCTQ